MLKRHIIVYAYVAAKRGEGLLTRTDADGESPGTGSLDHVNRQSVYAATDYALPRHQRQAPHLPSGKRRGNLSGTRKLRRRGNQIFLKDACRRQDAAIQAIIASLDKLSGSKQ